METYITSSPNIRIILKSENNEIKKSIHHFVSQIERTSPYLSTVKFYLAEGDAGIFNARLEVVASSFEILLTKQSTSYQAMLEEFKDSFNERLKPWLDGRFSA